MTQPKTDNTHAESNGCSEKGLKEEIPNTTLREAYFNKFKELRK